MGTTQRAYYPATFCAIYRFTENYKKMDSGTIIFVAILVLSCVIPLVIVNRNKSKKEKLFFRALTDLAEKSNCRISEYDLWRNTEIGIDKAARKLFYIRNMENEEVKKEINLAEIQKCRVFNSSRTVINNSSNQIVTERLELAFVNRDKNVPDVTLEFYNSTTDSLYLNGEIQLTEKWAGIINSVLTSDSPKR